MLGAIRRSGVPWWHAAGGPFVLSQGLVVGTLGIALFTVALVAGQTLSGLAIDSRGLGTVAPKVITVTTLLGAVRCGAVRCGAVLALIAVVNLSIAGLPRLFPANPVLYIGGLVGVLLIDGFAVATACGTPLTLVAVVIASVRSRAAIRPRES